MEFWLIMIAFIVMGGSCSLAGTWWDRKNKKVTKLMGKWSDAIQ